MIPKRHSCEWRFLFYWRFNLLNYILIVYLLVLFLQQCRCFFVKNDKIPENSICTGIFFLLFFMEKGIMLLCMIAHSDIIIFINQLTEKENIFVSFRRELSFVRYEYI